MIGKRERETGDVNKFEIMYKEAQKDFYVVGFAAWQTNNGAVLLVHFRIHLSERLTQSSEFYFHHRRLYSVVVCISMATRKQSTDLGER